MFALLAAAALAAAPTEPLDAALTRAAWDLGVCVGMTGAVPPGAVLRVDWTLDDAGRTALADVVAVGRELPPGFAECAEARIGELRVPTAPGWRWVRTLRVEDTRFVPIPLVVEQRVLAADDACVTEARARVPSVGGVLATGRPSPLGGASGEALYPLADELGDDVLSACARGASLPSERADADVVRVVEVAVPLPADAATRGPLSGSPDLRALVDRRLVGHGALAPAALVEARRVALCDAGHADACAPFPADLAPLAERWADRCRPAPGACDAGDAHACLHDGEALLASRPHRARALFERAAALGEDAAWEPIGRWWFEGSGGVLDRARAEAAWTTGCAVGDAEACAAYGDRVVTLQWPGRKPADVLPSSEAGCRAGDARSCLRAARIALEPVDDLDRAAELAGAGCVLGDPDACAHEAALHALAPRAAGRALAVAESLDAACVAGDHRDWEVCAARDALAAGQALGSFSPTVVPSLPMGEVASCDRYGELHVGVVVGADGVLARPPEVLYEANTSGGGDCVLQALAEGAWPRPRDGEVTFARLELDFENAWFEWHLFGIPLDWPAGRLRWRLKGQSAGSTALPVLLDALRHDAGLGACYDGSEFYPPELELIVGADGLAAEVKPLRSSGSDEVDACLVRRLAALRLPGPIDGRTKLRVGLLK